jgi:hypothetical protein
MDVHVSAAWHIEYALYLDCESHYFKKMALSLSSARGNVTRYANSQNWSSFSRACVSLAGFLKKEGKEQLALQKYMCALIYSLQGAQDCGRYEWTEPFDPDRANSSIHATKPLAALIEDESDLKDVFESVAESQWHQGFLRPRDEVWEDVKQSVREAKIRIKRLLLEEPDEYQYPASVDAQHGEFPTEAGLIESNLSVDSERHPLNRRREWIKAIEEKLYSPLFEWIAATFDCARLDKLIVDQSKQHGIFVRSYFTNAVRREVIRKTKKESAETVKRRIEASTNEDTSYYGDYYPTDLVISNVYDFSFLRSLDRIEVATSEWFDSNSAETACEICERPFRVIDLPHWVYRGSAGLKTCCFSCPIKERPSKNELYERIPSFVEKCGFIPKSDAGPTTYSFTSRLADNQKPQVFEAYGKMGGMTHVTKEFDSWFHALAETEALPEGFRYSGTGVWCLAEDGHKCHSLAEQQIDNWLTHHGVEHEREPAYPQHDDYNPTGKRRADWKVGNNVVIEYFGMTGDSDYDEKSEEKILLSEECGLQLIALYPKDLDNLSAKLAQLLK